ncbi:MULTISPECIES: hypothetical protein [unclassified Nostoc]|nr:MULTISPECIES: hypothetical protein [unclassified Nostoc]MDZ8093976.1 hypothetical protein [Nostoc sp. DedQUE05]
MPAQKGRTRCASHKNKKSRTSRYLIFVKLGAPLSRFANEDSLRSL